MLLAWPTKICAIEQYLHSFDEFREFRCFAVGVPDVITISEALQLVSGHDLVWTC
jgi:hypothetical protein